MGEELDAAGAAQGSGITEGLLQEGGSWYRPCCSSHLAESSQKKTPEDANSVRTVTELLWPCPQHLPWGWIMEQAK